MGTSSEPRFSVSITGSSKGVTPDIGNADEELKELLHKLKEKLLQQKDWSKDPIEIQDGTFRIMVQR